ncbi:MAG: ArsR family transcriptional regulator [Euzebyales bacterium]|nr:ArsR family transcriptional regulator [Euzebyales bacterium]
MALGQDVGRVLSDGRIVGRAEPFAKVFASSRAVKREVGLAAWGVLEDIALDSRVDDRGRLVAETNVRRIAANLGLNKDTVNRHLRRLREYGFVLQEELRDAGSGRYDTCRYVLDPSACLERFTHTPDAERPRPKNPDTVEPDTVGPDTVNPDENIEMLLLSQRHNNNSRGGVMWARSCAAAAWRVMSRRIC